MGKNDGSVEGKQYFECQPNFGLFVPMSKISKSPKTRMQKMSLVSPPKLCRQRSDMSEKSVASTIESSAVSGRSPLKPRPKLSVSR